MFRDTAQKLSKEQQFKSKKERNIKAMTRN